MNPDTDTIDELEGENKDYGDEIDVDDTNEESEGQPRDKQGRFAKDGASEEGEEESEEESESEEEPEEEEGSEEEDEDPKGKKENLPIRLNKALEQRDREKIRADAAERELQEMRAKAGKKEAPEAEDPAKPIADELEVLYEQVEEARADGDTKLAAKLQRQIDANNRKLATMEAEAVARKTTTASVESQRFDAMVDTAESLIPALDPNSDEFDKAAVADLEHLVVGYERSGLSPTKALHKAVKLLHKVDLNAPARKPEPKIEAGAEEKAAKKPDAKKPDVKKAVDTQKRQPPDSSKRGVDNDSQDINIAGLSDDEFAKLPESLKSKHRGDEF